jgi:hypothetical protein
MKAHALCGRCTAAPPLPTISGRQSVNLLLQEGIDMVLGYLGASVPLLFNRLHAIAICPPDVKNTNIMINRKFQ